jgi:hypothetical protein
LDRSGFDGDCGEWVRALSPGKLVVHLLVLTIKPILLIIRKGSIVHKAEQNSSLVYFHLVYFKV